MGMKRDSMQAEKIIAKSDRHYVVLLNDTARFPANTIREYMQTFSTITEAFSGIRLRWDSPENFVTDLKAAGQLTQDGDVYTLLPSISVAP